MSLNPLQVIERAMRLNGALSAGDTPDADDAADYLLAMNTMKRAWFGTLIGPRLGPQDVTGLTTYQGENGGEYMIPSGQAFTLIAPGNPRSGARFGVVDAGLAFAATPCTIMPNGRQINGATGNLTLSTTGVGGRWWFRGDTGNWVLEADYATAEAVIEFPDAIIAYMPYMLAVVVGAETGTELRQDVIAGNAEGRAVIARHYGRRGRGSLEGPIGVASLDPAAAQAQGR